MFWGAMEVVIQGFCWATIARKVDPLQLGRSQVLNFFFFWGHWHHYFVGASPFFTGISPEDLQIYNHMSVTEFLHLLLLWWPCNPLYISGIDCFHDVFCNIRAVVNSVCAFLTKVLSVSNVNTVKSNNNNIQCLIYTYMGYYYFFSKVQ